VKTKLHCSRFQNHEKGEKNKKNNNKKQKTETQYKTTTEIFAQVL
jgi:hypothetical protein